MKSAAATISMLASPSTIDRFFGPGGLFGFLMSRSDAYGVS
jgi:hypothetical protein